MAIHYLTVANRLQGIRYSSAPVIELTSAGIVVLYNGSGHVNYHIHVDTFGRVLGYYLVG